MCIIGPDIRWAEFLCRVSVVHVVPFSAKMREFNWLISVPVDPTRNSCYYCKVRVFWDSYTMLINSVL